MDRRKLSWITWVFVVLTVLVLVMMLMDTLHGPDGMVLPDTSTTSGQTGEIPTPDGALAVVEVSPSTVQAAVETLARPEAYRRTVTVEQFWSGGSSSYEIAMAVSGPWTRTDRTMPDGRVRHTITGPEDVYIWYNNEAAVYTSPVGDITADHELPIPTYEDILSLDVESIIAADYRTISNVACIYAEAQTGEYTLRYWIGVDSGLLVAAEKLLGDETVYRMLSLTVDQTEPTAAEFTLPDGTFLW
ncbi:hypothetical protein [Pusillibacter faecalis]|uniref:hypothetical protein n=1 Tax=Pusillibacter faecalis TaxID=2714358 RepID=UPI001BCE54A0|nr:hypothetical protein [Pusillibacter faecalis]